MSEHLDVARNLANKVLNEFIGKSVEPQWAIGPSTVHALIAIADSLQVLSERLPAILIQEQP